MRLLVALLIALSLLAGCGKKGALYLPGEPNPPAQTQNPRK